MKWLVFGNSAFLSVSRPQANNVSLPKAIVTDVTDTESNIAGVSAGQAIRVNSIRAVALSDITDQSRLNVMKPNTDSNSGNAVSNSLVATTNSYPLSFLGKGSRPNKRIATVESEPENVDQEPEVRKVREKDFAVIGESTSKPIVVEDYTGFPVATDLKNEAVKVKTKSKVKKVVEPEEPERIRGMLNKEGTFEGHLSIREHMKSNNITMPLMDFLAWSPAAIRELKRLLTREGKLKKARRKIAKGRKARSAQIVKSSLRSNLVSHDFCTRLLSTITDIGSFKISASIRFKDKEVRLLQTDVQADQGSDMNLISPTLVRNLNITPIKLEDIGFKGMSMLTAD